MIGLRCTKLERPRPFLTADDCTLNSFLRFIAIKIDKKYPEMSRVSHLTIHCAKGKSSLVSVMWHLSPVYYLHVHAWYNFQSLSLYDFFLCYPKSFPVLENSRSKVVPTIHSLCRHYPLWQCLLHPSHCSTSSCPHLVVMWHCHALP